MTYRVTFEPWSTAVEVPPGSTVLDAAKAAGIPLGAVCAGRGTCGKCRVRVLEGDAGSASSEERTLLPAPALSRAERLACRTQVRGPLTVETLRISSHGKDLVPPLPASFHPVPTIRVHSVHLIPPTLDHPVADADALLAEVNRQPGAGALTVDYRAAQELPLAARSSGWNLAVSVRSHEVIAVRPASAHARALGLAVDLGTTNIVAYLYDLADAAPLGVSAAANPLSSYGADIISRLVHAQAAAGNGQRLQRILVKSINALAESLGREHGDGAADIQELVVVGNSGMHHLFLDLPGKGLVEAPFVPALRAPLTIKAREIGIAVSPGAGLYLPPLVGGFVGSDLVSVALATGIGDRPGVRLALDVGTNTELLLSVDGTLTACSTASGPALEGAALRFGSVASPGAIDRVWEPGPGAALECSVIGGGRASGICGSGIVDLVACLFRTGAMSRTGRLSADARGVRPSPDGDHLFVLAPAEQTALGTDLTISQSEIRSIQLAKGAIRAGIDTLMSERGIHPRDIEEVFVAGTFGSHLSVRSMLDTGLLPPVSQERVRRIGNAAGTGAAMMLLSDAERDAAGRLSERIRYVELARRPGFMARFARAQWFAEASE